MSRTAPVTAALLSALGLAVAGCVALPTEMPDPAEGARLFAENCAACHGASGRGDGLLAGEIGARPADLTRIAARAGGFDRAAVLSTIDGYTRVRQGVHRMPEFGAFLEGPEVPVEIDGQMSPVPRPLAALMLYLESIQR